MEAAENDKGTTAADESEIRQLKEQLQREHQMYLRALADFDNYRRRVERERESAAATGRREIVLGLLDVVDNFELALQHVDDTNPSLSEGLKTIYRKLLSLLERQGVTPIKSLGEMFDPRLHEAIGSVQDDNHKPGTVVEELQKGYRWADEILRPARVRVAI